METASEADSLRAEVARLTARIAELEAGDVSTSAALAESRQRMDYALGVAGIVTWDWDPVSGHVLHSYDVNHNLSGQVSTRSEFVRLIHPDDAVPTAAAFEKAFREGTEYRHEYRIVTAAGTRWILSAGRPFDTPDGRRRMSGVMFDVTARHDADDRLRAADERLRLAVDAAQLGDWSVDVAAGVTNLSERAAALFGLAGQTIVPRDSLQSLVHPDDVEQVSHDIDDAIGRRDSYAVEYRIQRAGVEVWILAAGRGQYDGSGALTGLIGVVADVTARREAEERQQVLMRELNHRVKNTLAIVQALALQSRRNSDSPEAFALSFDGRLRALSAAHSLLTSNSWQGVGIGEVALAALQPFDTAGQRIAIGGPPVMLGASVALNFALAFHELATNAVKYGALSNDDGRIAVDWLVADAALSLEWRETGGPPAADPTRRGFGLRLIREGVTRDAGGTATLDFAPAGLSCTFRLPLSEKVRPL